MAANSKIEWTDHTFNPWLGCTKLSPACDHCYAETWARRMGNSQLWEGQRKRTGASNWHQPIKWNRQAAEAGVRRKVFCASLADVFDNQVPDAWRDDLWRLIEDTPQLDWLLLTKRPQNIVKMLPNADTGCRPWGEGWANVWLGATAEDQERYRRNWPALARVPARLRFVSYEPALGPIGPLRMDGLAPDWLICGGESGPHARPMHPDWARRVRDECDQEEIAFFFKQWGEWGPGVEFHAAPSSIRVYRGEILTQVLPTRTIQLCIPTWEDNPAPTLTLERFGKRLSGRLLDDVEHSAFPRSPEWRNEIEHSKGVSNG